MDENEERSLRINCLILWEHWYSWQGIYEHEGFDFISTHKGITDNEKILYTVDFKFKARFVDCDYIKYIGYFEIDQERNNFTFSIRQL